MGRRSWVRDISEQEIQRYIEENFAKFGIEEIEGPFAQGPDFLGRINGKEMYIEAEREWRNYLEHGHNVDPDYQSVEVLIVLDPLIPRGVIRSSLPPEILAINLGDFYEWQLKKKEEEWRKQEALRRQFDGMEIRLVRGGEVLFAEDLNSTERNPEDTSELMCSNLASYFSLVSNERRLKVMRELMRRKRMRFSDILQIAGNPKLVKDCVDPLIERGMLERDYPEGYRITAKGDVLSNYLLVAIPLVRKFLQELGDEVSEGEDQGVE